MNIFALHLFSLSAAADLISLPVRSDSTIALLERASTSACLSVSDFG